MAREQSTHGKDAGGTKLREKDAREEADSGEGMPSHPEMREDAYAAGVSGRATRRRSDEQAGKASDAAASDGRMQSIRSTDSD